MPTPPTAGHDPIASTGPAGDARSGPAAVAADLDTVTVTATAAVAADLDTVTVTATDVVPAADLDAIDEPPAGDPSMAAPRTTPSGAAAVGLDDGFVLDAPSGRAGARRRRLAAGAVVAAAVLVSGAAVGVRASGADPTANLRTATVSTRTVAQTIDAVATVEPVSQARVAFPVSGTIATVEVTAGATVTTGQVLATLDGTDLQVTINERRADLANAQLSLQQALNGETVTGSGATPAAGATGGGLATGSSGTTSGGSTSGSSATAGSGSAASSAAPTTDATGSSSPTAGSGGASTGSTAGTGTSSGTAGEEIAAAQQSVVAAQAAVDAGLLDVEQALADANQRCAAIGATGTPTTPSAPTAPTGPTGPSAPAATPPTTSPGTTVTTITSATTAAAPDASALTACQTALTSVLAAQQRLAAQQTTLDQSVRALTAQLESSAAGSATGSASGSATSTTATTPTTTSATSDPSTTTTATAAELIAHQKAVDAASVALAVAEQGLEQATIVSPIDGTVVALDLAVGDDVSAASATAAVVVAGGQGYELTTTVSVTDLPDIEVGQPVAIRPDSTMSTIEGAIVAIGVTPSVSSTTSYPVTIGITGDATGLRNGATASVSIVTDQAADATAVPASAVTVDGDRATVTVLDDGQTRTVEVGVGATGSSWMAVTSGVELGQTVVLADLDDALPGSATDGSAATTDGPGAFPGAGAFAGGPPTGAGGGRPGG